MFLMQFSSVQIDPRGLLLGGMIIGSLGVLDDLVTSQSAAVVEIHDANPALGFRRVFEKAMRIGQDHVAATVNTLVLAYTGASLPLLLMFTLAQGSYGYLLNSEYIAEEVVRTLVGSLALMAAVPISTLLGNGADRASIPPGCLAHVAGSGNHRGRGRTTTLEAEPSIEEVESTHGLSCSHRSPWGC